MGRTTLRRHPERGVYDRETVHSIIDEALFCHVAYVVDGLPSMIPTIHARVDDTLYVHGSAASRTLRSIRTGQEVCIAITLLDGLVLARSMFNHSMNYRSVILYGQAREVTDLDESLTAQLALMEHVARGRSNEARMPNEKELKQTSIVAVPIDEAAAKIRTGPPKDDEDDLGLPVWAGVLPVRIVAGTPERDPASDPDIPLPGYLDPYRRP
jgi:nitroimidazol reductase NimA-like FMN-containing flavoprotein (pyridoxamine 5'-phosphate oxidase superfamily)